MNAGSAIDPLSIPLDRPEMSGGTDSDAHRLARELSREFSAPVGMLGPAEGGPAHWLAREGPEAARWPDPSRAAGAAADLDPDDGGASLWLPGPGSDHIWLILRLPAPGRDGRDGPTAWVGFTTTHAAGIASRGVWGPSAPPPALLAWGRAVLERYRLGPSGPTAGRPATDDAARLRIIERLAREMLISEPPKWFQRTAVESLREALAVEAIAWVPRSHREPVVVAGQVAGLGPESFRRLLPDRTDQAERAWGDGAPDRVAGVRRALAVSAESEGIKAGWLVAVNPLDGQALGRNEADLLRPVAALIASQRSNARHYAELKDLLFGAVRALTAAIDAKDPYTLGHSERVGRIAAQLGEALGLSSNERGDLYLCGLLHDIGKIGIRDATLQKPGPLSPEEFGEIRRHPAIGVQILADLKKLHHLLPGVAHHHENFDGSGYPEGLAGDRIPRIARILAVADAFDAMSSSRPYRRRLAAEQIDRIFRDGAGTQWDPEVVDALFACREAVERIRQKGLGPSVVRVVDETIDRAKEILSLTESMIARGEAAG